VAYVDQAIRSKPAEPDAQADCACSATMAIARDGLPVLDGSGHDLDADAVVVRDPFRT
jgi:hypothetical protein